MNENEFKQLFGWMENNLTWTRELTAINTLRQQLTEAQAALAANESQLFGLLAVIHRDDGSYREEHGTQKAVTDALAAVCAERVALDEARAALNEIPTGAMLWHGGRAQGIAWLMRNANALRAARGTK